MAEHHAFGATGGARGIDEIGKVVSGDVGFGIGLVVLQEVFHIDGLALGEGVHAVGSGDDEAGVAILEDELDAVGRIVGVAGDIGGAGFEHAEQREDETAGARQQQRHTVARVDTTGLQGSGHAGGDVVHLAIGERSIDGNQSLVVGLALGEVTDALMEETEGGFADSGLADVFQLVGLTGADNGQLAHTRSGWAIIRGPPQRCSRPDGGPAPGCRGHRHIAPPRRAFQS